MSYLLNGDRMILGTCYYPEHWPKKLWKEDLERMLEAGIEVIRIAEFAWNLTEPEEGVFRFDFFDRFLLRDQHFDPGIFDLFLIEILQHRIFRAQKTDLFDVAGIELRGCRFGDMQDGEPDFLHIG